MKKNNYLAIDLGTTNSVVAYGTEGKKGFAVHVVDVERKTASGNRGRAKVLPSTVFYTTGKDGAAITEVGDYAKQFYGKTVNKVAKSVKSHMGTEKMLPLADDVPDKKPEEVSARILHHMLQDANKKLFLAEDSQGADVIITVPASYSYPQCKAVLNAARLAGIDTDNEHDILLHEPKAVIYNFLQMLENEEIPEHVLELTTPKNIMVFDLGGGTLDVTLHKVGYKENNVLSIEDIAISRYTQIGGDNFDELIACALLRRFEEQSGIQVPVMRRSEVLAKFMVLAEDLKKRMSEAYVNAEQQGVVLEMDYAEQLLQINIYDSYSYDDDITRAEFEDMISPLMGRNYVKEDCCRINEMSVEDMDNIIYPVLDVLNKAGKHNHVDAVIMNGGMTKLYAVQNRIAEFFGIAPMVNCDPDLAVAQGAVYYHYLLHRYNVGKTDVEFSNTASDVQKPVLQTGSIMNDTVHLGLAGAYVAPLAEAGTALPYVSETMTGKFVLSDVSDIVAIELYLGRRMDKNLPNYKVAGAVAAFTKKYAVGTGIAMRFMIDSMRMVTLELWPEVNPADKVQVQLHTNIDTSVEKYKKTARLMKAFGQKLNVKAELHELSVLQEKVLDKKTANKTKAWEKLQQKVNRIKKAGNPEEFAGAVLQMVQQTKQYDRERATLYNIACELCKSWPEAERKAMLQICRSHFTEEAKLVKQDSAVLEYAKHYMSVCSCE